MELSKKQKILACHGNVNVKSICRMVGTSKNNVYNTFRDAGLSTPTSGRSLKAWKENYRNKK